MDQAALLVVADLVGVVRAGARALGLPLFVAVAHFRLPPLQKAAFLRVAVAHRSWGWDFDGGVGDFVYPARQGDNFSFADDQGDADVGLDNGDAVFARSS